jgi:preprotein translocase subunit SecD
MELRLKGFLILIVFCVAVFYSLPTYRAYQAGVDPQTIANKVNLGLDLQGGMYLDIEIKVEEALQEMLRRTGQELEDLLIDNFVKFVEVRQEDSGLVLEMERGERVNLEETPYDRFLVQFEREQVGDEYRLRLIPDEEQRIRENAVSQALEVLRNRIDSLGVSEPSIQKQGENSIIIQLPGLKDREQAIQLIGPQAVLEFRIVNNDATPSTYDRFQEVVRYQEVRDPATQQVLSRTPFVLGKEVLLTGEYIRDAQVRFDPQNNQPYVSLSFDSLGADRFGRLTEKYRGKNLAIILDDKVQSAPVIREKISGGEASISGSFTTQEASNLAIVLRSGSLPAPIEIREERTVGASLGEDSVRQGLLSLVAGGVSVLIFMVVYYRLAGVFAAVALIFNMLLIVSMLGLIGATLTLPGMAGIVLTIGMAVDANVLIFQRIREEMARSKNIRAAIYEGFNKAFKTILDANITTLFAALALLQFGTGPIKGFAVTLSLGILSSMFTAIVVTRFLFEVTYLNRKQLKAVSI